MKLFDKMGSFYFNSNRDFFFIELFEISFSFEKSSPGFRGSLSPPIRVHPAERDVTEPEWNLRLPLHISFQVRLIKNKKNEKKIARKIKCFVNGLKFQREGPEGFRNFPEGGV